MGKADIGANVAEDRFYPDLADSPLKWALRRYERLRPRRGSDRATAGTTGLIPWTVSGAADTDQFTTIETPT